MRPANTTIAAPSPSGGGAAAVLTNSELRAITGVLDDQSYSNIYLSDLADTATSFLERYLGHRLKSADVVDYYPGWPYGFNRGYGSISAVGFPFEIGESPYDDGLQLSASSPEQAALTASNYNGLAVNYLDVDNDSLPLPPALWTLDLTEHYPVVRIDGEANEIEVSTKAANPISASYTYVAPPLSPGVKEAVSFVVQQIYRKQNSADPWDTPSFRDSLASITMGLAGGLEKAQVF